jgi:SRSO17 transposase
VAHPFINGAAEAEQIKPLAELDLKPQELSAIVNELASYHAIYSPLFRRSEQRAHALQYLQGLLLPLERKSIEPMLLKLVGADSNAIRAMQQFIGAGAWEDGPILDCHRQQVSETLGEAEGVLLLDGSDFPKQGKDSVGVKRQYCGELGKRANCQAGVFLGYASGLGYTLLDRRLYLPKDWANDKAYAERRQRCGVPEEIAFKTKLELGWEMIAAVDEAADLPYRWVVADEAFGRDTKLLDQLSRLDGKHYFVEVPHDTRVWAQRPELREPSYSGRGRKPSQAVLAENAPPAQTVSTLAEHQRGSSWQRYTVKEGSQGPMVVEAIARRVYPVRDDLPAQKPLWLVLRRNLMTGELKTYLSNAPAKTPLAKLVELSAQRWPIESCFRDGKQYLGMGDYEVRSWGGWYHHMTLCILAHHFLVQLQLRLKKNAPALTLPQVKLLLGYVLPLPVFEPQSVLDMLCYIQRRNHAAYLSHRKRRLRELALFEAVA